jgi:hypothetical protein
MQKTCAFCQGCIFTAEEYWKIGEDVVHAGSCYWSFKRKKKVSEWPNTVFRVVFVSLILAFSVYAEQPNAGNPKTDEKGCLCFYSSGSGKFYYNAFIKTADKQSLDENGESEIWGYNVEPGNMELMHPKDENGQVIPINARRDIWIPADGKYHDVPTGTGKRKVKCPPYWGR